LGKDITQSFKTIVGGELKAYNEMMNDARALATKRMVAEAEAMGALDFVRGLFADGLVQSAFWHRFALTVHSPVANNPSAFGIAVCKQPDAPVRPKGAGIFARNELAYEEENAPDWDRIGHVLRVALYNFQQGRGLDKSSSYWKRRVKRKT
jgi:hypothetical protein